MLLDQNCMFSDKQAVTATAASENVMDLTASGDAARGLYAVCTVDEAFAGVSKLTVSLQTAEQETFDSSKTLFKAELSAADLQTGKCLFQAALPQGCLRFVRGFYEVTGSGTSGKLSLFLTDGVEQR